MVDRVLLRVRILPALILLIYGLAVSIGAFSGGMWGAVGIGGALLLWIGIWIVDQKLPVPDHSAALLGLLALIGFACQIPFSFDPTVSSHQWLNLVSTFLPLLFLTSPAVRRTPVPPCFITFLSATMAIALVALGVELLSGGFILHHIKKSNAALTEYNRGIAQLVIVAFPLFAALWAQSKKKEMFLLMLLFLFPASLTESHTAKLALIVGLVTVMASSVWPRVTRFFCAALVILLTQVPLLARLTFGADGARLENMHGSWRHRIEIWDYLSYRIAEHPLLGWGLGTTHLLDAKNPHGAFYQFATQAAPHAHNFIVELWVETGLFGLWLGLGFLFWLLRRIENMHISLRPFAYGAWLAAVTVASFGFDFWTDALWASFALTALLFALLQQKMSRSDNLINI